MKKRTIGIIAHVDAGKTTLTEVMLYKTGAVRRAGRVDHGDTLLDFDAMERERGITIFSKQARMRMRDMEVTLLDTPGHVDFSAETERSIMVMDAALVVVSGPDGVEGHTRTLWKLLEHYHVPAIIFVNKMDLAGADRERIMGELQTQLSAGCVDFTDRRAADEEAALTDETLLDLYTEKGALADDEIKGAASSRKVFPVYFGSALKMEGIENLLEGIYSFTETKAGSADGPFGARVYKTARDSNGSRLTFLRVTSGTLRVRDQSGDEKISQIRLYSGNKYESVQEACAGEACAVTGLSKAMPGDGLGAESASAKPRPVLEAVTARAMILPQNVQPALFYRKIQELAQEDPSLGITWDERTHEIRVRIMGNVEAQILKRVIKDRFGTDVSFGQEKILYKETLAEPVIGTGHFEPLRHYAEVQLLMEPAGRGSGITVDSACSEDSLALNWQRLIMSHILETEHPGVLLGAPLTDVKITILAGRASVKHTEGGDFRQATYRAIRQGLMSGKSVILEPYDHFRLEVPRSSLGRAMSDLKRKGASDVYTAEDPAGSSAGTVTLTGRVKLSAVGDYAEEVRAYTKGTGSLYLESDGYDICSRPEEVMKENPYNPESDTDHPSSSVFCGHGAGVIIPWDQVKEYAHTQPQGEALALARSSVGGMRSSGDTEYSQAIPGDIGRRANGTGGISDSKELEAIMMREFGVGLDGMPSGSREDQSRGSWNGRMTGEKLYEDSAAHGTGVPHVKTDKHGNPIYPPKDDREEFIIVDGYNVIHQWPEMSALAKDNLDAARSSLINALANYQGYLGCRMMVVFDAYKTDSSSAREASHGNLEIVFTGRNETADAYIERLVHDEARKYRIYVATSDALEQLTVMSQGALRVSSRMLIDDIKRVTDNPDVR